MKLDDRIEHDGATIVCGRAGTGPDVVFCHGTPFSSRVWQRYADVLSADFTVHLWDMPGYGRSSKDAAHRVDLAAQARAFTAVLAHYDLDRPHVVAHDIGGAVSLGAALVEGARYVSLLLVDVVAIPPAGSPFFRFVGEHPGVLAGLPAYVHEAIVRAYVPGASHRGLSAADLDGLVAPWLGDEGQAAFYRQIEQFDEGVLHGLERRLGDLDLPVRILWGAEDTWIPVATGRRLAAAVPGADFVVVPGSGHLMQYDAPVVLADQLRTWLTRPLSGR